MIQFGFPCDSDAANLESTYTSYCANDWMSLVANAPFL